MLKKTILALLLIPASTILFSFSHPQKQQVLRTIIIDAGHGIKKNGGYDGASGTYSHEDDIALAVSKKLVAMVTEAFPDVRIVETRPTKYITSLRERADIANSNHGDLFISIHVNAMPPIEHHQLTGYKKERVRVGRGKHKRWVTKKITQYR